MKSSPSFFGTSTRSAPAEKLPLMPKNFHPDASQGMPDRMKTFPVSLAIDTERTFTNTKGRLSTSLRVTTSPVVKLSIRTRVRVPTTAPVPSGVAWIVLGWSSCAALPVPSLSWAAFISG
eukprot:CAMPEP_0180335142 /NCGR_PEP_ID=MMETSP0988-20121125/44069_1 /TAXON_ID=697907 /ORGANISM="non described non described, Strain CCMP2293" /LENGTH=119 /DNA_ID=CAMNT_0022323157 /DNA_START=80 /DNA_END=439 /DNA_ORIENTATION=-